MEFTPAEPTLENLKKYAAPNREKMSTLKKDFLSYTLGNVTNVFFLEMMPYQYTMKLLEPLMEIQMRSITVSYLTGPTRYLAIEGNKISEMKFLLAWDVDTNKINCFCLAYADQFSMSFCGD